MLALLSAIGAMATAATSDIPSFMLYGGDHLAPSYYYQLVCPGAEPGREDVLELRSADYLSSTAELAKVIKAVRKDAGDVKNWVRVDSIGFDGNLLASGTTEGVPAGQLIGRLNCFYGAEECSKQRTIAMACAGTAGVSDRTYAGGMRPRIVLEAMSPTDVLLEFEIMEDEVLEGTFNSQQAALDAAHLLQQGNYTWSTQTISVPMGCGLYKRVVQQIVQDAKGMVLGVLQLRMDQATAAKWCSEQLPLARIEQESSQSAAQLAAMVV